MKVIAIINQKGGVGKTTTTANLAYAFAKLGRDVLAIDNDSQGSLTKMLNVGLDDEKIRGICEMLFRSVAPLEEEYFDEDLIGLSLSELFEKCVCRPTFPGFKTVTIDGKKKVAEVTTEFGFDLLPADLSLSGWEMELIASGGRNQVSHLSRVIEEIKKVHNYDYVLIDCSPSLSLTTLNAIVAAVDGVLIPTNMDLVSTRGVKDLLLTVEAIQNRLITVGLDHYGVIGIIANMFSSRREVDRQIQFDMNQFFPFKVFETTIPDSTNAKRAIFARQIYAQQSPKAATAYNDLALEIENQIAIMKEEGPKILSLDENMKEEPLESNEGGNEE